MFRPKQDAVRRYPIPPVVACRLAVRVLRDAGADSIEEHRNSG